MGNLNGKIAYYFCFQFILSYICTRKNGRDSVAQLVEHIPFKDGVLGSSPSWITKRKADAFLFRFNSVKLPNFCL